VVSKLLIAFSLMTACVVVHATGVTWALRRLRTAFLSPQTFWRSTWICVRLAAAMVGCHLVEIGIWALFYWWNAAMPDGPSSWYFSAVTYTTTGYGDLVLRPPWRLVGGVEALTGILMCGWSTGFFFAAASRITADPPR
jgi:Ion channel